MMEEEDPKQNAAITPSSSVTYSKDKTGNPGKMLPPEVLQPLLRKLSPNFPNAEEEKALLASRLMCKLWLSNIDTVLEEKRLDTWKRCELSLQSLRTEQPYNFTQPTTGGGLTG